VKRKRTKSATTTAPTPVPVPASPEFGISIQDVALIVALCDQDELLAPYVRALGINVDTRRAMVSNLKARFGDLLSQASAATQKD